MNHDEFREKLLASFPGLRQHIHRLTTSSDDADDLLQETLLNALCKYSYYRADANFDGLLYTIMHNAFVNISRKESHCSLIEIEHCEHINNRIYIDCGHSYCELLSLVESLPDAYRVPFEMHAAGYKYHEIAEMSGISIGTVKSRIHTARQRLKAMLQ